jgi:hypothetical protein
MSVSVTWLEKKPQYLNSILPSISTQFHILPPSSIHHHPKIKVFILHVSFLPSVLACYPTYPHWTIKMVERGMVVGALVMIKMVANDEVLMV